jgi:hypothetical protein
MAQHDYVIANQSGAAFRADLNNALAAIVSQNSGNDEPSTTYAYMLWAEGDSGLLKIRNAANSAWVTVGTMADTNLGLATLASPTFTGTVTIPTLSVTTTESIPRGAVGSLPFRFSVDTNTGLFSPAEDEIALVTGGTTRMLINSDGYFRIGQTTTDTPGVLNTTIGIGFEPSIGSISVSRGNGASLFLNSNADSSVASFQRSGVNVGSIGVTTTATAYYTSSDYRLKENIVPLANAADRVQQLNPCRFNFAAEPNQTVDGFLAHEAQAVVPEAVTGQKDAVDQDGNPIYQGIDQAKLVPLLTAALQEALDRIADLEACVAAAGLTTPTNN